MSRCVCVCVLIPSSDHILSKAFNSRHDTLTHTSPLNDTLSSHLCSLPSLNSLSLTHPSPSPLTLTQFPADLLPGTHTHIHLQYLSHDLPTYLPFAPFDICLEKCILCVINFTISIEINLFWEKRTSTKDKGNTVCC